MPQSDSRKWNGTEATNQESADFVPLGNGDGTATWVDKSTIADLSSAVILVPDSSARNVITPDDDFPGLILQGWSGLTDAIMKIKDYLGNVRITFNGKNSGTGIYSTAVSNGDAGLWGDALDGSLAGAIGTRGSTVKGWGLYGNATGAGVGSFGTSADGPSGEFQSADGGNTSPTVSLKQASGQTGPLLASRDSTGTIIDTIVDKDGHLVVPGSGDTWSRKKWKAWWQIGTSTATSWQAVGSGGFTATMSSGSPTAAPDADGNFALCQVGSAGSSYALLRATSSSGLPSQVPTFESVFKTGAASTDIQDVRIWAGLWHDNPYNTDAPFTSGGVGFRFSAGASGASDTNWQAYTTDATGSPDFTKTDSGVAVAANTLYAFKIVFTNSTTVEFYINGSLVATHTTHIPGGTVTLFPYITGFNLVGGTTRDIKLSNVYLEHA